MLRRRIMMQSGIIRYAFVFKKGHSVSFITDRFNNKDISHIDFSVSYTILVNNIDGALCRIQAQNPAVAKRVWFAGNTTSSFTQWSDLIWITKVGIKNDFTKTIASLKGKIAALTTQKSKKSSEFNNASAVITNTIIFDSLGGDNIYYGTRYFENGYLVADYMPMKIDGVFCLKDNISGDVITTDEKNIELILA